jgi:hypothetical protein
LSFWHSSFTADCDATDVVSQLALAIPMCLCTRSVSGHRYCSSKHTQAPDEALRPLTNRLPDQRRSDLLGCG